MVVEVMGCYVGWIVLYVGMVVGVYVICIFEVLMFIEDIIEFVISVYDCGCVLFVVVFEGFKFFGMEEVYSDKGFDVFNWFWLGGIGDLFVLEIECIMGIEICVMIFGYI